MAPTPPEEIAKQHLAALALIASDMPRMERVDHGEVPLVWKERPTCVSSSRTVTTKSDGSGEPPNESIEVDITQLPWCISSRGQVDVAPIVKLVLEGVEDPAPLPPLQTDGKANGSSNDKGANGGVNKSAVVNAANGSNDRSGKIKSVVKRTISKSPVNKTSTSTTTTTLQKKSSPTNLWNEQNASLHNVKITRPSHDAWGIKKIILVFCDDFLSTVYRLPWYQTSDGVANGGGGNGNTVGDQMHKAIQPILDCLGIAPSQMVRCLLAALPPGVTIPVHHDTGEWVKYTHRVHVPIIVPDEELVLFRCGPTEQSMGRVDCTPGHVFEMNNQAKHAVTNGGTKQRVHLILDYVDPSFFDMRKEQNCPVRHVTLSPGEIITQTRRSIDRALESGSRAQPSFLILGAQKAGTTSLYEYMTQHPWIVKAKRRETHCLDWRWNDALTSTEERRNHCLQFYHAEAMKPYPSLRTGDSTPSYLLDYYRVIPRLRVCFPHEPKLIVLVRDPIKRALSHYAMVTSMDGSPEQLAVRGMEWREKSLEEVLEQDVKNMKEDGLLPYWDVESKTVDRDLFNSFINTSEEDEAWERYVRTRIPLNTGSYSPLARGLYALQCRQWFRSFSKDTFLVMKLEDMSSEEKGVQWVVNRTLQHLGLPRFDVSDVEKKNSREYVDPLEGKVELNEWLQRFFEPHNERFGRMLMEEMGYDEKDWTDIWRYD